jgi:hypothetical protein
MVFNRKPCGFSIELHSKNHLDIVSLLDKDCKGVVIEGSLGPLQDVDFLDGTVLVIKCKNGIIRIDLTLNEFLSFQK